MANYRAVANGNWSSGATWGGGAVPPDAAGHDVYANGFTVTIDQNVNVNLITIASNSGTFVGGGTAAAGGNFQLNNNVVVTANISRNNTNQATACVSTSGTVSASINGNITSNTTGGSNANTTILHGSTGTLTITGNLIGGSQTGLGTYALTISSAGTINIIGNVTGGSGGNGSTTYAHAISNTSSGIINVTGNVTGGSNAAGICGIIGSGQINIIGNVNAGSSASSLGVSATGSLLTIVGDITAANGAVAVSSSATTNRFSGSFLFAADGTNPITCSRFTVFPAPANARTRYSLNGSGTYINMFTADNNLGQANPTDVRSGVSYASGTLTGRLTVPARGSVALSVAYGPSMPFTATRSGTTATATLAYSYPLVVGDQITVTGASNAEWNSTYTIASIVSGTSVTFEVPASHSSTAGTGAVMQTTGTAVLDPASIASAVQSALTAQGLTSARAGNLDNLDATVSSRLAPSGTLATVTTLTNAPASVTASDIWSYATRTTTGGTVDTLTNAPSVPSASAIASQVRTELGTELGRIDQPISTRATPANIPTSDITAIKVKTDALNTTRLAQVSTTEIVGSLLAQANS